MAREGRAVGRGDRLDRHARERPSRPDGLLDGAALRNEELAQQRRLHRRAKPQRLREARSRAREQAAGRIRLPGEAAARDGVALGPIRSDFRTARLCPVRRLGRRAGSRFLRRDNARGRRNGPAVHHEGRLELGRDRDQSLGTARKIGAAEPQGGHMGSAAERKPATREPGPVGARGAREYPTHILCRPVGRQAENGRAGRVPPERAAVGERPDGGGRAIGQRRSQRRFGR